MRALGLPLVAMEVVLSTSAIASARGDEVAAVRPDAERVALVQTETGPALAISRRVKLSLAPPVRGSKSVDQLRLELVRFRATWGQGSAG